MVEDAPVVKYIQKVLLDAIPAGLSDIHSESYEKFYRILPPRRHPEEVAAAAYIKDKMASRIRSFPNSASKARAGRR